MAMTNETPKSLESILDAAGGPVNLLRGSNLGPYRFPVIPPEFTNWRDEVRAWKDGCALLEQSYHMTELHLRGLAGHSLPVGGRGQQVRPVSGPARQTTRAGGP
ncbi:hypothetical protein GCM10010869_56470 [Mesorhizobium tianshanense]|uniref:Uncharacterized protein n=1 Tax=Mesorhizobium tianshanense TaxID=39844 RepID=A0A562NZM6_9HYPH|nr:hypothetical protein [Mesorhizobium tianshanense]TWI37667.1 hypothetical protein IQ26_02550 [Mesorhizobium tianshanense]GLS40050.1 hypothetical protein GCM10010869_56470 [Mesorhizobium tianshanense]